MSTKKCPEHDDRAKVTEQFLQDIQSRFRGEDPNEYKEKCLRLCQTYLSGHLLRLGLNAIEVERLTGGLTNQIYRCKALTTDGVVSDETEEVV